MPGLGLMKSGCHKLQTRAFRKSCVMHSQDLLHIRTLHKLLVWHSNSFAQCVNSRLQLLGKQCTTSLASVVTLICQDLIIFLIYISSHIYVYVLYFYLCDIFFWYTPFVVGLYYHLPKRAAGIRYVFIGKPMNQRPR